MFSPDKKIEMVSKSEQILRSDEVATFERIWSVNEKNELVLEKIQKYLLQNRSRRFIMCEKE